MSSESFEAFVLGTWLRLAVRLVLQVPILSLTHSHADHHDSGSHEPVA